MAACLLASGGSGACRVKSGLQNAEREDRALGVNQPDGMAFRNKNKGINRCRKTQGTDKNRLSNVAEQGFSQRLSNHLKLQPVKNALILI